MPLTNSGTPRWQKVATFVLLTAILLLVLFIYGTVGSTDAAVHATEASSARRDCATSLSAARRNVFDQVDIYKAHSIQMLSDALLDSATGVVQTADGKDRVKRAYAANNMLLTGALVEASALPSLDHLIARGGTVAGVHYSACPK